MAANTPYSHLSTEVKSAMDELSSDDSVYIPQREAEELLNLPDCVQIFFVSPEGKVSTFSELSTLRIFRFKEQTDGEQWVPTFIQVNGWTHPLIPGASPVLESANGAFMFPDVYTDMTGASIGLVLSDAVSSDTRDLLRTMLTELTALKSESPLPEDQRLGTVGSTIVKGAEYVSLGLDYGAKKACELIEYVGEKQKERLPAAQEETKVNPALRASVTGARYATHATVKVSGFVAERVGKLTKGLSNYLAGKIEKPVTGAVVGTTGGAGAASRSASMHNLIDAARGGLIAYGTIYTNLEESAKVLGTSVKKQSVNVVQHRYGQDAGSVFGESMTAAGNAAMTYMNVQSLGVKGLVKKTAKDTGKQVGKAVLEAHARPKDTATETSAGDEKRQKLQ